ncbi:MAG: ribosome silencing factor [Clostridia bacterium]|nr:ribosome silencing factor [Clostridia bacterium]
MTSKEKALKIAEILDSKKAQDIRLIEIADLTIIADYFVIATGTSSTQVKALIDEVEYQFKQLDMLPTRTEGYPSAAWILADYGDVVLHVFQKDTRDFYSLERLWADGKDVTEELKALLKSKEE